MDTDEHELYDLQQQFHPYCLPQQMAIGPGTDRHSVEQLHSYTDTTLQGGLLVI